MKTKSQDYVDVIYNESDKPFTSYPDKLSRYLFQRYALKENDKLLDIGCGRGEFLNGFIKCGVEGFGVDQSDVARRYCANATLATADLECEPIPFDDNSFDVVYSKSVIEHFHKPEILIREMFRVLKPGGIAITLCPDCYFNYRIYFEDFTHRTPFMQSSLRDIQLMQGFDHVEVVLLRQLPVLWRFPWLFPAAELTRILAPEFLRSRSKWVRFSKEVMLLASARKPNVNVSSPL